VAPPGVQLLSFLESWEPRRFEVTGLASLRIRVHGPVRGARVETLTRIAEGRWTSRTEELSLWVRGLMPLAGNGLAGDADGLGLAARFRRPEGLALMPDGAVAVADSQAHVIRVIHPDRGASTLCGSPGDSGHQDGDPASARFRGPTFLAAWPESRPGPALVVSDSGNHVIRAVDGQGRVTTLAGVPGRAGHLDAPVARDALFQDPQGLAVDEAGNILVADRGNHVIRKISAEGAVTTLAGLPGSPGALDGAGPGARFAGLRGLALSVNLPGRAFYNLYVVDGHSVRRVTPVGEVTVFCGDPAVPGPPCGSAILPGKPCLNQPHGLAAAGNYLVVADRGNHAVQILRPDWEGRAVCSTVAGDPDLAVSRSGLLRCNIPGPLEEEYGALDQPLGVTVEPWGTIFVSDGAAVVQCVEPSQTAFLKPPALLIPGRRVAAAGAPFTVGCSGPRPWGLELDEPPPFLWSLAFIDPRTGRPAAPRIKGEGSGPGPEFAKVTLEEPGEMEVHLTCVTPEGLSLKCVEPMTVVPAT
jgi:DNA-binding beta-propeller fold protein YncE